MTVNEFKAWFEGFTESMERVPTKAQWNRIKEKIDSVDDMPTSHAVFIERHLQPYRTYWSTWSSGDNFTTQSGTPKSKSVTSKGIRGNFDLRESMRNAGKIEYKAMVTQ